jgi:DNA-binding response OmpR family regulator
LLLPVVCSSELQTDACSDASEGNRQRMKILLVEDDTLVSRAIVRDWPVPSDQIDVAPTYAQCARAMASARIDEYDAVILDMNLPDGNAIQLISELRARSDMPAIVISGAGSPETRASTLDIGADDYLMKPFSIRELQARVARAVNRLRGHRKHSDLLDFDRFQFDLVSKTLKAANGQWRLTDLEFRLLSQLTSHVGKVFSRQQLCETACLRTYRPDDKTVDIYIARLRAKLAQIVEEEAIETVRGVGYRFVVRPTA